jgi:hypothetical protein
MSPLALSDNRVDSLQAMDRQRLFSRTSYTGTFLYMTLPILTLTQYSMRSSETA